MGHSQFMQKSCTMAHVENPSPNRTLAEDTVATVQLPQSCHSPIAQHFYVRDVGLSGKVCFRC